MLFFFHPLFTISQPFPLVVVVGHTECGAAAACFGACKTYIPGQIPVTVPSQPSDSPLNRWLVPLTTLAANLQISSVPPQEALPVLVRENVMAQVQNLCQTEVIRKAWANGKSPMGKEVFVHGWVYDVSKGTIMDLGVSKGPHSK